jgi:citrate synthase
VLDMLDEIHRDGGGPQKFIDLAKKKDSGFKLMGFGHRVYKNYDPRAKIIKAACDKVLTKLKIKDPLARHRAHHGRGGAQGSLLRRAQALSQRGLLQRHHLPRAGIPTNMFTVMFAIGRLPGWLAHWKEMHEDPSTKIGRPRQIYTGPVNAPTCRSNSGARELR